MRAGAARRPRPRARLPMLAAVLACQIAGLCAPPGAAQARQPRVPRTYTASSGAVTATLTATEHRGATPAPTSQALHLQIARAGVVAYSADVRSAACEHCGLLVARSAPPPVQVVDLEGTGEPNVVVQLYSGGAHCCTTVQVLTYQAGTYRTVEHDFFEAPSRIADLAGNGSFQFVSADNHFAYEFAPYAYSALPLQVLDFSAGAFTIVTREFPAAIRKDAAKWFRVFRAQRRHALGNGPIAAWAADEELLGRDAVVRATLAREAQHGRLRSRDHYGPSGYAFVRKLLRFLKQSGYHRARP